MLRKNRVFTLLLCVVLLLAACLPIVAAPPAALNLPQPAAENVRLLGRIGGPTTTIAAQGDRIYVGFSYEFAIFDQRDPSHPVRLGYLPKLVSTIHPICPPR